MSVKMVNVHFNSFVVPSYEITTKIKLKHKTKQTVETDSNCSERCTFCTYHI